MPRVREERVFWTHQLHSKVLNSIGAVILQSQVCERAVRDALPSSADEVSRLKQMLLDLEDTTRSLLTAPWRPSAGRLGPDIQDWVERLRVMHPGTSIICNVRGVETRVPARVGLAVTGVVVESMSNALRHGNPTAVEVAISFFGDALLLRIRDDGQGFDVVSILEASEGSSGQHFGVSNMRHLAEMIGANFVISSAPGRGTQVTLYASWAKVRNPRPSVKKVGR